MSIRIMIGAGVEKTLKQLTQFFISNGYSIVGEADDGYEFLRRIHSVYPDICVLDSYIKGLNCREISEVLISENIAPVIAVVKEHEMQNFIHLNQETSFVPIIKPINKSMLLNTIQILIKTNRNIQKLEKEVKTLRDTNSEKEIISKAKKLLMINMHLTEEEAHRRIQKQSMEKGTPKIRIAEEILLMYE
ncbi:MAG: ANTAR domain-containing response regulator [Eubacteriales bacterium]